MNSVFTFDVDGTLTEARQPADPDFNAFFHDFAKRHPVFLISGSDRNKIVEQLPLPTIHACQGLFTCSGAELWDKDDLVYRKDFDFPEILLAKLQSYIENSPYPHRFGTHIEPRPGMVNMSVVGRDATIEQRKAYHAWDNEHKERLGFVTELRNEFPEFEFSAGGEISIDIVPLGWTKAVAKPVIEDRFPNHKIVFLGDKMGENGNDKPLGDVLKANPPHEALPVNGFRETWDILKQRDEG